MAKEFVLKKTLGGDFRFTSRENFEAYVSDARKIREFRRENGFESEDEVLEYIEKYFGIDRNNVEVK